ncbi:unnamed protein product [Lactuca virosa]|uniref:Uncharacterized protein n=1 Tax=Lactuca virosa TaxID=75947 RepID=A0AAU9NLD4_9ASTR|nr:unnamed protein product [Lactuca virosa]
MVTGGRRELVGWSHASSNSSTWCLAISDQQQRVRNTAMVAGDIRMRGREGHLHLLTSSAPQALPCSPPYAVAPVKPPTGDLAPHRYRWR